MIQEKTEKPWRSLSLRRRREKSKAERFRRGRRK
jgi:hypothetical protein